ncbi:hypothetical protein ACFY3M_43085 [Streptomyces mirabilis]|uniref:hypothetical protein n=1 Tax=Streptomyces mirabilis TaxID=68239 RepID=UPI003684BD3A
MSWREDGTSLSVIGFTVGGAVALVVPAVAPAYAAAPSAPAAYNKHATTKFGLFANRQFLPCLSGKAGKPTVTAEVTRGELNDELKLHLTGFKPDLDFDLFTVQRSNQLANG